jgi:hypothetical protein
MIKISIWIFRYCHSLCVICSPPPGGSRHSIVIRLQLSSYLIISLLSPLFNGIVRLSILFHKTQVSRTFYVQIPPFVGISSTIVFRCTSLRESSLTYFYLGLSYSDICLQVKQKIQNHSFPQSRTHATPRKNGTGVRFCCAKLSSLRLMLFPIICIFNIFLDETIK